MQKVNSSEFQKTFGKWLDRSHREPVAITRYERPTAYLVSAEFFEDLLANYRKAIPVELLTEAEVELIRQARVETATPFKLADLPDVEDTND